MAYANNIAVKLMFPGKSEGVLTIFYCDANE